MKKWYKWYRIFELVGGEPTITSQLAFEDNFFKTDKDAEKKLPKYVKEKYGEDCLLGYETFLILPIFTEEKYNGIK